MEELEGSYKLMAACFSLQPFANICLMSSGAPTPFVNSSAIQAHYTLADISPFPLSSKLTPSPHHPDITSQIQCLMMSSSSQQQQHQEINVSHPSDRVELLCSFLLPLFFLVPFSLLRFSNTRTNTFAQLTAYQWLMTSSCSR